MAARGDGDEGEYWHLLDLIRQADFVHRRDASPDLPEAEDLPDKHARGQAGERRRDQSPSWWFDRCFASTSFSLRCGFVRL